ncbi:MAG: carbohydrate ABC transporter permease [Halanaerobiales bacterium]
MTKDTKRKRIVMAYIFLAPALILMAVFVFYPVIAGLLLGFFKFDFLGQAEFIGLENFREALGDSDFWLAMRHSITYLIVVPFIQVLSILMAIVLNRKIRGKSFFRAAYYIPVITSMVAVSITWKWLLKSDGIVNSLLSAMGLIESPISFLNVPNLALYSVMFVTLWKGLGYYMIIYLAGLQSVPRQLEEAARIDGARNWQVWRYVTIPLLKPSILLCTVLSARAALKVFDEVYVMTGGGPMKSSLVANLYIYQTAFNDYRFGYAAALGFFLAIAIGIFTFINFKFLGGGRVNYNE